MSQGLALQATETGNSSLFRGQKEDDASSTDRVKVLPERVFFCLVMIFQFTNKGLCYLKYLKNIKTERKKGNVKRSKRPRVCYLEFTYIKFDSFWLPVHRFFLTLFLFLDLYTHRI